MLRGSWVVYMTNPGSVCENNQYKDWKQKGYMAPIIAFVIMVNCFITR